jgi:septum site-determining protein MinC
MAIGLVPEPPLAGWLGALDAQIQRSPAFFDGRPVVLDLSALPHDAPGAAALVEDLLGRGLRLVGIEGADTSWVGSTTWGRLPMVSGGRSAASPDHPDAAHAVEAGEAASPAPSSLLIDRPVRSGQSVVFPQGDVTVVGSVASGSEVMAGGSIHVYGALRGRAVAGMLGNSAARIFCRRLEAELVAIDGLYRTADDMDQTLRGRAVQAWLEGEAVTIAALD